MNLFNLEGGPSLFRPRAETKHKIKGTKARQSHAHSPLAHTEAGTPHEGRSGEARWGQEKSGEARRGQTGPGEARWGQERPGEVRWDLESPGGARRGQESAGERNGEE